MLQARVAQEPVTDDMHWSQSQALVEPETVAFKAKISPEPPALWMHQPMVASAAMGAAMSLVTKR